MASQGQDSIGYKAGQITGQAQVMTIPLSYYASYLLITFFFFLIMSISLPSLYRQRRMSF
jgi:hypothetical protein